MTGKRAAIYCRISSDREGRELGVDRQREDCQTLITNLGHTLTEVYVDNDLSASTRSRKPRPSYQRLLADARAGHLEVITAYTSSRITRRPRENEDLIELAEKHGVEFAYVRSPSFDLNTAAGRLIARVLAAADAAEAEAAGERVTRAKLQAATNGLWRGGRRPFGYEPGGMTIRASEAAEVAQWCEAILHGVSLNGIVRDLNARGIATVTGKLWDAVSVRRVLLRARNAGLVETRGEVIGKGAWEPLVSEDLWRATMAILSDPARRTVAAKGTGPGRKWLGSGLYRCHCGELVYVAARWSGDSHPGHSYVCKPVRHLARVVSEVDRFVGELVVERLSRPDAIDLLAEDVGGDPSEAIAKIAILRGRQDELASMFADGKVTAAQLVGANEKMDREIGELQEAITRAGRQSVLAGVVGAADIEMAWRALPLDRQRVLIQRLFTVELLPGGRGRRPGWRPGQSYFDPNTVRIHWNEQAS